MCVVRVKFLHVEFHGCVFLFTVLIVLVGVLCRLPKHERVTG